MNNHINNGRIPLGEAIDAHGRIGKPGSTVYLDQVYPNLSEEAEHFMKGVIGQHLKEVQERANENAEYRTHSRSARTERSQYGAARADSRMTDLRAVVLDIQRIVDERIERGDKIPAGISPEVDARAKKAEQERYAGSLSKQEMDRAGALMNQDKKDKIAAFKAANPDTKLNRGEIIEQLQRDGQLPPPEQMADAVSRRRWYKENTSIFGAPEQPQEHGAPAAEQTQDKAPEKEREPEDMAAMSM